LARISIIGGAGYVGLAYAAALADLGHEVWGLDLDDAKVQALSAGHCPIYEPGLAELIQRGLSTGRLRFTTDYGQAVPGAEFLFLCVGTPSDEQGRADLSYVVEATKSLARHLDGHTILVNKSTLPVGSVTLVEGLLMRHAEPGVTYAVVSNPEFLREGSAVHDLMHPDRVVLGGSNADAVQRVAELYASFGAPIVVTDPRSAELIKYASNAFLAAKISFINEIALICEQLGGDVASVTSGIGLDQRIGRAFLNAGVGFGGSCFPKDVRALTMMARDAGLDSSLLTAILDINRRMRLVVVEKLENSLGDLRGRSITLLGLAFKPDTDDVREAPAIDIVDALVAREARVRVSDPAALEHVEGRWNGVELIEDPYAAAMGADAVVLVTDWNQYRVIDLTKLANSMRGDVLVDGRRVFSPAQAAAAGLTYLGIGHSSETVSPRAFDLASYGAYLSMAAD